MTHPGSGVIKRGLAKDVNEDTPKCFNIVIGHCAKLHAVANQGRRRTIEQVAHGGLGVTKREPFVLSAREICKATVTGLRCFIAGIDYRLLECPTHPQVLLWRTLAGMLETLLTQLVYLYLEVNFLILIVFS